MTDSIPSSESPEEREAAKRGEMNRCPALQKGKKGQIPKVAQLDIWLGKTKTLVSPGRRRHGWEGPWGTTHTTGSPWPTGAGGGAVRQSEEPGRANAVMMNGLLSSQKKVSRPHSCPRGSVLFLAFLTKETDTGSG